MKKIFILILFLLALQSCELYQPSYRIDIYRRYERFPQYRYYDYRYRPRVEYPRRYEHSERRRSIERHDRD